MTGRITFSGELRRAMSTRGLSEREVERRIGLSYSLVGRYSRGLALPSMDSALRLADVLDWPGLADIMLRHRSHVCEGCGITFVDNGHGGQKRRFCTHACNQRTHRRRAAQVREAKELLVTRREVERFRDTLRAWCMDCTAGEGLCRDDGCAWRGLSVLPYIPLSAITKRTA